jgi:hypothetical protein
MAQMSSTARRDHHRTHPPDAAPPALGSPGARRGAARAPGSRARRLPARAGAVPDQEGARKWLPSGDAQKARRSADARARHDDARARPSTVMATGRLGIRAGATGAPGGAP